MPVPIRIISEGRAILLNRLPVFIISSNLSPVESDIFFKSGAKTAPRNIEPPTQIDALRRCIHVIMVCSIAIKI
jgi:hypothetical protein